MNFIREFPTFLGEFVLVNSCIPFLCLKSINSVLSDIFLCLIQVY